MKEMREQKSETELVVCRGGGGGRGGQYDVYTIHTFTYYICLLLVPATTQSEKYGDRTSLANAILLET